MSSLLCILIFFIANGAISTSVSFNVHELLMLILLQDACESSPGGTGYFKDFNFTAVGSFSF